MSIRKGWHTAANTAALLSIGRLRLRNCELPYVQVGRRRFYWWADIEAYGSVAATNRRAERTATQRS